MLVATYIRVSGRSQVDGDGPDRQRDTIQKFLTDNGLKFGGEYFEKAVSGTTEAVDRPVFSDLLERVKCRQENGAERIEAIVVERADRLARDLLVAELLFAECRKIGLKVFAADRGKIDIASNDGEPTAKLIRQVVGAVAEWEKQALVIKLRKARERARATRGRCEGQPPFGYYPHEQPTLEYIMALHKQGLTFRRIQEVVNLTDLTTRSGKPWDIKQIFRCVSRHPEYVKRPPRIQRPV